jgi:hypothetical protein
MQVAGQEMAIFELLEWQPEAAEVSLCVSLLRFLSEGMKEHVDVLHKKSHDKEKNSAVILRAPFAPQGCHDSGKFFEKTRNRRAAGDRLIDRH